MKIYIKKGDNVQVTTGVSKGSTGRVVSVDRESAASPQGGITKKEAAIHISNLLLVDPTTKKGERVAYKKNSDGKSVRYFKKSGEQV
jgi:large subunit ribosomal protein L24